MSLIPDPDVDDAVRTTYECLRCGAEVTSATHREMVQEGWSFYRLPGMSSLRSASAPQMTGPTSPECEVRNVAFCFDCGAFLRLLREARWAVVA